MDQQILKDLVTTSVANDYDYDKVLAAFPELEGVDTSVIKDYVTTAVNNKFNYEKVNKAFPELFPEYAPKKAETQTDAAVPEDGTASTSEDGSSASNVDEETQAMLDQQAEFEKQNPHLAKIQELNKARAENNEPIIDPEGYQYDHKLGWTTPGVDGKPQQADDDMSKILEEKRIKDNEWAKKEMPTVTQELIGTDDNGWFFGFGESGLDRFVTDYSEYGFSFSSPSSTSDSITVTALNGASMTFDVDGWSNKKDKRVASEVDEFMKKHATRGGNTAAEGNAETTRVTNAQKSQNKQKSAQETKEYTDLKKQVEILESQEYIVSEEDKEEAYKKAEAEYRQSLSGYRADIIDKKMQDPLAKSIIQKMANEALAEKSPEALRKKLDELERGQVGSASSSARINKAKKLYAEAMGFKGEDLNKFLNANHSLDFINKDFQKGTAPNGEIVNLKDIYNNIGSDDEEVNEVANSILTAQKNLQTQNKNISQNIEDLGGGWFRKPETQKLFKDQTTNHLATLSKEEQEVVSRIDRLNEAFSTSIEDAEALKGKIDPAPIRKKIEEIQSKEYKTEEEVEAANAEIQKLKDEYQSNVDKYNTYISDNKNISEAMSSAYRQMQEINLDQGQLDMYSTLIEKNHQLGTQAGNAAFMGAVDMIKGLNQVAYMVNPFGEISDWAIEEGIITDPYIKTFINAGKLITSPDSIDWDNDPVTPTAREQGKKVLSEWQTNFRQKVQDPVAFGDIQNSSDAGEWFVTMLGGQLPQLTAMALTGGTAGLVMMGGSAAGQKFDQLEQERSLYKDTDGAEGTDYGFWNMWTNSILSGTAEGLSERVTFGQIKYVKGALRGTVATAREAGIEGASRYLRQNVFNKRSLLATGKDFIEEGGSESLATISGNLFDMASGKEGVTIYDDVAESFVSGVAISGSIKSPVLFKHMMAPFKSVSASDAMAANNQRLQEIKRQLHEGKNSLSKEEVADLQSEVGDILHKNKELIEIDANRVDMLSDSEKSQLLKLNKNNSKLQAEYNRIVNDKTTPDDVKQRDLDRLNERYKKNEKSRQEIINKYPPSDVKKHQKQQQLLIDKTNAQLKKLGSPLNISVKEVSNKEMQENLSQDEFGQGMQSVEEFSMFQDGLKEAANDIINDPNSSPKDVAEAKEVLQQANEGQRQGEAALEMLNNTKVYGGMIPTFTGEGKDRKLTGFQIELNPEAIGENGKFNTQAHEFVHAVLYNTMKNDPGIRTALGDRVIDMLSGDGIKFKPGKDALFNKRIAGYKADRRGEEIITIASEMLADGDIEFNDSKLQQFKDFFRQFAQNYLGRDIQLDTSQDVRNFMKDMHTSIKNNKPNAAITRMMAKGAGGLIVEQAKTPQQQEEARAERAYSKSLDANIKSDPDLKQTFDKFVQNEDGSPKHVSQDAFAATPDYTDAYFAIVEGRALDALVQNDMTKRGLPPEALREFTRKVKEELGRRFLTNFNLDKNNSLFGWLTGVSGGAGMSIIYRAKGDVINQYKAEQQADTTSLDREVGDSGSTVSDLMQGERDSLLEQLDEQDLSIGRKEAVREVVNELKAREVFEFNETTNNAIDKALDDADVSIENLTYKGVKQFLNSAKKITRVDKKTGELVLDKKGNPKLFNPTKESDVTPTGPLYGVLDAVAKHFGVDAKRILANQDLNAKQRKQAQLEIFDRAIDANGNLNQGLIGILAEGQTRSGEATGAANTKLGDLYAEGARLKVAEGASKKLGQKKAQDKRTDIAKEEFLALFNMNSDGSDRGGTSGDGAIRAFIVQMAQLEANQQLRIKSLSEGTFSDAARARLGDGKGLMAFNKDSAEGRNDRIEQVFAMLPTTDMSDASIDNVFNNVYSESTLPSRTINSIKNEVKSLVKDFNTVNESLKDLGNFAEFTGKDVKDFFIDAFFNNNFNKGIKKNLMDIMPKDENGKPVNPGNRAKETEGINKQRSHLVNTTAKLAEETSPEEAATRVISQLMPMYAGASKIGDGSKTVTKAGGEIIDTPNWEGENGGKWKRYKKGDKLPKGKNIGDFKLDKKGKKIARENRQQVTTGKADFLALVNQGLLPGFEVTSPKQGTYMLNKPDGSSVRLVVEMPAESTKGFFTSLKSKSLADIFRTRKQKSLEARQEVKRLLDDAWARVQSDDSFDAADFGLLVMSLGSSMDAPLRRAAYLSRIPKNFQKLSSKLGLDQLGKEFQYEHAIPKEEVAGKIIQSYMQNNALDMAVFDGYTVDIIPKIMDKAIDNTGHKFTTRPDGQERVLNEDTAIWLAKNATDQQIADLAPLMSIDPDAPLEVGQNFIDVVKALRPENTPSFNDMQRLGEGVRSGMWSKETTSRGMSAFDFDETLIMHGDNFIIATDPATGNEIKISSGDWPLKGPELMQQGYDFNFDDFINVRGGVEGPLFQKFKNRIAKYGPENNYILTARPMESAVAIHGWLKSKGVNIPLENITGLGNSTGAAKAQWMLDKFAEGYNDMYFVDDALPNVEAVANVIDQLDIKGKSVQAKMKFSKDNPNPIDDMLERNKGVPVDETFNRVKARNKGKQNRKRQLFIPPSADDFEGLMYYNYGKGKQGDADAKFFKEKFYDPFNRADRQLDMYKQKLREDAMKVSKALPDVSKNLTKEFENTGYTNEQAMRIYLYDKNGHSVPGISEAEQKRIAGQVAKNRDMVLFAGAIEAAVGVDGYLKPEIGWNGSSFNGDISDAAKIKRAEYIAEWQENVDNYFTEEMLNKLEAVHGSAYRSALEDTLARMKSGTNRPTIRNKTVNAFLDWLNGSVGAIMFFNARSAVLQTLSTVNFINFEDNNIFAAAKAFGNQKQYWKDFSMLFNSPMLKQRRGGLQSDLNASELQRLAEKGGVRAVVGRLLELGFAPTQIADSFAISAGGSTFYRNRVNKYVKEGMNQKQAEEQAFVDFQEIAEATQQSSRPDKISQEQASVLGRLILAFQNTPMQYNRLIKKAALDLINGRGNTKANISRILYYGAAQNIIFASLQSALFAVAWNDDEDEEFLDTKTERIANGTLDSLLRGSGIYGAVLSTVKNTIMKYMSEREKGMQADNGRVLVEALNVSPPLGSKVRKLYSAMTTDKWNKGVYSKIPLTNVDNPIWDVTGNLVEASFNVPLARIQRKLSNLKAAMDNDNANWQRLALFAGWDKWGLGIDRPEEIEEARQEVKQESRDQKKKERKAREAEVKQEQEEKYLEDQKNEKEEDKKPRCAAATKSGSRCKGTPVDGTYCTIHTKVEKRSDGKEVQCKKVKSDGKRCKMQTSSKSGLCYYHD